MSLAIIRAVPRSIAEGERTHLERVAIDYERAVAQHEMYTSALRAGGCEILELPPLHALPDSVFVEDIAVVFDELAVITRPGAPSRRGEIDSVEDALARYRELSFIEEPGTLDGGDVLVSGRNVWAGISSRTNHEGIAQLARMLAPHGYRVAETTFDGCLHLKSAATRLPGGTILLNPRWVDGRQFHDCDILEIDSREPFAANALTIGRTVLFPSSFPRTRELLARGGFEVRPVDLSELAKAEGALTCCSLLVGQRRDASHELSHEDRPLRHPEPRNGRGCRGSGDEPPVSS